MSAALHCTTPAHAHAMASSSLCVVHVSVIQLERSFAGTRLTPRFSQCCDVSVAAQPQSQSSTRVRSFLHLPPQASLCARPTFPTRDRPPNPLQPQDPNEHGVPEDQNPRREGVKHMSTWLFSYLVLIQQGMMKARGGLKCSTNAKRYQGSGHARCVQVRTRWSWPGRHR